MAKIIKPTRPAEHVRGAPKPGGRPTIRPSSTPTTPKPKK
jgi:hypothetical protein